MKQLLTGMLCAFFLSGCGIDYDGATKLVFEGRVTGADGQPLQGVKVSTQISNSTDMDIISYDFTDSNGRYLMIFPKPDERVDIEVIVNSSVDENTLSRTGIFNIGLGQFEDFKIDFGTSALYETENSVTLHINFPNGIQPLKIGLTGLVANNLVDYNFNETPEDGFTWPNNDILVAPDQVITLKYMLSNGSVLETEIPIGDTDVTFNVE
ncbi:hypothetical protein [Flavobacterium sp.]|uniref:hypothetical protein n=1 Tax=Flavobacterium sp. TaxID=239 RepID=UPI004034BB09